MSFEATNRWETMKTQLFAVLEANKLNLQRAIDEAGDGVNAEVSVRTACSEEAAEIITRIFTDNATFLKTHLREWVRTNLKCNVETRGGDIFFSWDDPTLLRHPDAPSPMYGDET